MRYETWQEAHDHAQKQANNTSLSLGIEKTTEYGRVGFNVCFIPKPGNRYGCDYTCEAVEPEVCS